MRALALAPAAALALLVTNHPVIASGLSTIGQANLTSAAVDDKVSEKTANHNHVTSGKINDVTYVGKNDSGDNPETPNQTIIISGKSDNPAKYSVIIDGEKFEGDLNTIPSDQIAGMEIIKTDSGKTIHIAMKKPGDTQVNATAQEMPQFPGGEKAMLQWLSEHIQYPAEIKPADMPEKVRVVVKFVVDKNGRAVNPEIVRGGGEPYNAEALRVIGEMPRWKPGTLNGEPVDVHYSLPVNFRKPDAEKATNNAK